MIKISNLNKTFGKKQVLENLNCNIQTNSIYGLIGANGAGKSTLLRLINDIYRKDSGSILIDGVEVENNEEVKQKLAFLPDDLYIVSGYTLSEMANYYKSMYKKFDMKYLEELADILKLDLNTKLDNFSKGMKRQCALICILATNADYMFFDETFDGLDPVVRNLMKKILAKQMSTKNTTIIMTSHNLRELEDICDNLGVLYKGGVLFESDIDSLKKVGSVATIIFKGERDKIEPKLKEKSPLILDFLSLTLEEIFIYEMEVIGYEFNQVI